MSNTESITGIVEARDCATCGHHELGILADDKWMPIRPGMRISIHGEKEETPRGE